MFNSSYDSLTPEEVMDYLNIGRNSLYALLNSGEIKAFRVGRNWKIPRKSLDKYIDESIINNKKFIQNS